MRTSWSAFLAVAVTTFVSSPAMALSCATGPNEELPPTERVAQLASDDVFTDRFQGAAFGWVRAATTQDEGSLPDYGRTEVVVEVTGWFGPALPERVVIVEPDPGWMAGYGLDQGSHYFIPYVLADGERRSSACDPIEVVPVGDVPALMDVAQQAGLNAAANTPQGPVEPDQTVETLPIHEPLLDAEFLVLAVALGLAAMSAVLLVTGRRRHLTAASRADDPSGGQPPRA